jgi:predicted metalloprotease
MRFDENAQLDTSNIDDLRGSGGGGGGGGLGGRVAVGGGGLGIVGVIIFLLLQFLGGGNVGGGGGGLTAPGGLAGLQDGQTADTSTAASACKTGAQANTQLDCEVVAVVNSVDNYWSDTFARSGQKYTPPRTEFFTGSVNTGCGAATSDTGPFYCPADKNVYIDLSFYQELQTRFGAQGGNLARAYVIAHEYGHHVQDLLGTTSRVQGGDSGPTSNSVRIELQADCYAGVWTNHAASVPTSSGQPLIEDITPADINSVLDTASRIGDDFIQTNLGGGRVNQSQFTHGTSAQREKWFTAGYQTGDPTKCDTFARGVNLG